MDSAVADFLVEYNTSTAGIINFTIISTGYIVGQTFLLQYMNSASKAVKSRSGFITNLHRAVFIVQFMLAGNVVLIIIQIFLFSTYLTSSLVFVTYVSNFFTAGLLLVFALRFISWYKDRTHSLGIVLYAVAFFILVVSETMAGLGSAHLLFQKEEIITPASEVKFTNFPKGSFFSIFFSFYRYFDYSAFSLILIANALLLYNYSRKINKPKIIIIIALPILSYTSSILDALNIYDTDTNPDLFSYYIYQTLVTSSAGALFGFSFWIVSKKLPESPIKTFLKITAFGFTLLYLTNHVGVIPTPYPPFGINSLSLLPLSSYFVLFGLYSSALSLSQDITLRQHLRAVARNDSNLLSSIGTAQMEMEVKRAVGDLKDIADQQEKELAEKSGIETPVPESEIEDYLKQVIEEVKRTKK